MDVHRGRYFVHFYTAVFLHKGFICCNGLRHHCSECLSWSRRVCHHTNPIPKVKLPCPFIDLLQGQTCIAILKFHAKMNLNVFDPFATQRTNQRVFFLDGAGCRGTATFTLLLSHPVAISHRANTCPSHPKQRVALLPALKTIALRSRFLV